MRFGLPHDAAPRIALALAVLALLAGTHAGRRRGSGQSAANDAQEAPLSAQRAAPRTRAMGAALVGLAGLAAALLSAAYVAFYLRGGPRIIDATTYWLEARAIAAGYLAWPLDEPAASVMGRFLLRSEVAGEPRIAGIFPPGFPAVLALGFLAGAPLAVGPLLAAALTVATFDLAKRLACPTDDGSADARAPLNPALAVLFSVLCAALRYHTADTMSHGLAALCFTVALAFAQRALDHGACGDPRERAVPTHALGAPPERAVPPDASNSPARSLGYAAVAGLATGWLTATRPPSALALAASLLVLLLRGAPRAGSALSGVRLRIAAAIAIGAIPGLALLAAHQHAATGAWASSQTAYYAVSDGPPGCFRYGFGAGIGCLGEHGAFVRHNLPDGYGFLAAAGTTLRRLKLHLMDALNAEPLFALVLAGAAIAWRSQRSRILVIAPLFQLAAYAPFYFDGNYPGGGARFLADTLPLEHALAAVAVAALFRRAPRLGLTRPGAALAPAACLLLAAGLPLAGFALRAGFDHAALRDREGGLPMFDPSALERAGVTRGIVFVDTDHGFNLGHAPGSTALQVLRYRGDTLDRAAWEARGRPPAFRYRFDIPGDGGLAALSIDPLPFDGTHGSGTAGAARRTGVPSAAPGGAALDHRVAAFIEGESLWPPLAQHAAWAQPEYASAACASSALAGLSAFASPSGGRVLAVHATSDGDALARLALPAQLLSGSEISPHVVTSREASGAVHLVADGREIHTWHVAPMPTGTGSPEAPLECRALPPFRVPDAARIELTLIRGRPTASGDRTRRQWPAEDPTSVQTTGLFALDGLSVMGGKTVDR